MKTNTAKISILWDRFYQQDIANGIPNKISHSPIYGVYSSYASDMNGDYNVLAGAAVSLLAEDLKGLSKVEIQEGDYLVFENSGEMPQVVIETWRQVWDYFSKSGLVYTRKYTTDFEIYKSTHDVAIYIAVQKKVP